VGANMDSFTSAEVKTWTIDQVSQWALKTFGERTAQSFKAHEVDGESLLLLKHEDYKLMNTPAGPARKLLEMTGKLHEGADRKSTSQIPKEYRPFKLIKNLVTPEEIDFIRNFFSDIPSSRKIDGDYDKLVFGRLVLPSLEEKLAKLFPDMMVFTTHYFTGAKEKGQYSGWHTGINLSKLFIGNPDTCTVWIPLQTLSEKTGGRLWFYNGEYLQSFMDILRLCDKKNNIAQYLILKLIEEELEKCKITDDCNFGDAFLFWEINPHKVDTECIIVPREILSVRLVKKGCVIDEAFLEELRNFGEKDVWNYVEDYKIINSLSVFLEKTKIAYHESLQIVTGKAVATATDTKSEAKTEIPKPAATNMGGY